MKNIFVKIFQRIFIFENKICCKGQFFEPQIFSLKHILVQRKASFYIGLVRSYKNIHYKLFFSDEEYILFLRHYPINNIYRVIDHDNRVSVKKCSSIINSAFVQKP